MKIVTDSNYLVCDSRTSTLLKRIALAVVVLITALSFSQTGRAQTPCLISRGLDPLDVLNSGVRHNVWIVLDSSGSMGWSFDGGQSRMEVARDVLTEIIDEFVDASGRSLVNWGYVRFDTNWRNRWTACNSQFSNNCVGLNMSNLINCPSCDAPDSSSAVKTALASAVQSNGWPVGGGWTPNGIAMDQISSSISSNGFVSGLLPGQKNFIILVTDGDDTCECEFSWANGTGLSGGIWTPTASPPFEDSVTIPNQLRGGTVNFDYTHGASWSSDRRAINAGTKGRLAYERLNPTVNDRATGEKGSTFVVGMGLYTHSQKRANHLAWEASGAHYNNPNSFHALFADDKPALKQALRNAFAKIGVPQSEVTLGSPVVGTVREVISSWTDPFRVPADHIGDVDSGSPNPDDVRYAREVRSDHRDNVLFSTTVEVPGFKGHFRATNIYKVTDGENPRTMRTADFSEIWDAGTLLRDRSPDSRNIYFNRRGETVLRPFDIANATPSDLGVGAGFLSTIDGTGAFTAQDARDMVVQVVRGYRLSKHPTTNTLYKPNGDINFSEFESDGSTKNWKLYDATATPAIIQNPTRAPDFDPPQNHASEYGVGGSVVGDGFYWDHFNRKTVAYLPTNGGVMHAFDAGTGEEIFGYIPDDVVGLDPSEVSGSRDTLRDLVSLIVAENNGIANHQFLLAGSPTVGDVFLRSDHGGDDSWHTLLTFGRGRGGRFMTGLDVSDPYNPALRFNTGNREGINDLELDGLGETWSTPVMGNVVTDTSFANPNQVDQWVVFFGGGYGCDTSDEGQYLYALRLEDGSVYYHESISNDSSATISHNGLVAMPRLYNPHEMDVADNKDYITRVYIGDLQGNIWKLVTNDVDPNNWELNVLAELGKDQPITAPVALVKDVNNQQVYVTVGTGGDQRVDSSVVEFKFVALLDTDLEGVNTTQYPFGSVPLWEKTLDSEERVYVAPIVIGKVGNVMPPVVFFAGSRPYFNGATCETEFFSSLYALGIFSGMAEVDFDGGGNDESIDLGEGKVTGLYARGNNLYVSESGGLGSEGSLSAYGDGDFSDEAAAGGANFAVQILVNGFRLSPF